MGAREVTPYRCAGCGKPAVGRIKPCDCPTRVGFRDGEPSVWLYDNKADAEIASLGLDPDTVATVRSGLTAAGYVLLSPNEVRAVARVVEIANRNEASPEGRLLARLLKGCRDAQ